MNNRELMAHVRCLSYFTFLFTVMGLSLTDVALAAEDEELMIEEVIVTAQKRTQNLKDVPISIAAMTTETIKQTGIRELSEIAEYIPNLEISNRGGTITIRGVGSSSRNIGFDSRVSVYVDGVYTGVSPAANQDILDLERIEVLRGPQGTLFGKNSVAGAISLVTKKPAEEFDADVTLSLGNFDYRRVTAILDLPLSEKVFAKLAVNDRTRDGYVTNLPTGHDLGNQNSTSYRAQLRALLTDNLEMNLSLDRFEENNNFYGSRIIGTQAGLFEPNIEPFTANNNFVPQGKRVLDGAALNFDWTLANDFTLKSISGYRNTLSDGQSDLDGGYKYAQGSLDFLFGITSETETDFRDEYKQLSQEFQLISPNDRDLQYVAGLYFYDQEGTTSRGAPGHNDPAHPFYAGGLLPFPGDTFDVLRTTGVVDTRMYAAYINGTYKFTDKLTLGLGGRYSEETKDVDWLSVIDATQGRDLLGIGLTLGGSIFGFPVDSRLIDSRTDTYFAPELSLSYTINEHMNAYYRVATGYKSGGYNLDFITQKAFDAGLEFDKETVISH